MSTTVNKIPVTPDGAEKIRSELYQLKQIERPRIIEAISEARSHGDLKENAEYHAAREQQSFLEGRIKELELKVSNMQIIDLSTIKNDGKVVFGSTVTLQPLQEGSHLKTQKYKIVGDEEADIKNGKISYSSPIARAVISKLSGEEVVVFTPNGEIEYLIDSVEY